MRTVSAALTALHQSGSFEIHVDWLIERPVAGVATLQSYRTFGGINWIGPWNFTVGVDQNIGYGSLSLYRASGNVSLSTLMKNSALNQDAGAYSPALDVGREIECRIALTAKGVSPDASYNDAITTYSPGNWIPVFQGIVDFVGLESNPIQIRFRDRSGPLADTFILDAKEYGSDGTGTPVETVWQQIADEEIPGQYVIETYPNPPGFNIRRGMVQPQSMWEAYTAFAQQFGWRFEQKWKASAKEFRLTIIEPDRDITVPHYSLSASQYIDVRELNIDIAPLRTIVRGKAVDKDTGEQITVQKPLAGNVPANPQVLKYGQRRMQLAASKGNAIDTAAELQAWVDAAYADLSVPPIPQEVELLVLPWAETGDYIQFLANGVHYDEDQFGAVHTITHESTGPGKARTRIRTTGKPKGAYANWKLASVELAGFNAVEQEDPGLLDLHAFGEISGSRTTTHVTLGWTRGAAVRYVFVHDVVLPLPIQTEPRTALANAAPRRLDVGTDAYTLAIPPRGFKRFVLVYGRAANVITTGKPQYWAQEATDQPPAVEWVSQVAGTTEGTSDVTVKATDPQNKGGTLYLWTNHTSPLSANPLALPDAFLTTSTTPVTVGPATSFALTAGGVANVLDDLLVHAGQGKRIYGRFVNSDGVESMQVAFALTGGSNSENPGGGLAPGVVDALTIFAPGLRPPVPLGALPTENQSDYPFVVLTNDDNRHIWKWNGTAYTRATDGSTIIAYSVTADKLLVGSLAAITVDTGVLSTGMILNDPVTPTSALRIGSAYAIPGTVTRYIDLAANGTAAFLLHDRLSLKADGSATFQGDVFIVREDSNGIVFKDGGANVARIDARNSGTTPLIAQTFSGTNDGTYWFRETSPSVSVTLEVGAGTGTHLFGFGEAGMGMSVIADGDLNLTPSTGDYVNVSTPADTTARTSTGTYLPIKVNGVTRYVLLYS